MALYDRGMWKNSPSFSKVKKDADRPWIHNGEKVDSLVDPLDSFDMEDSGLFAMTISKSKK